MSFTNNSSLNFILILIIILVVFFIWDTHYENFSNLAQLYQPVNYNKLEQDCNQLTWSPSKCSVSTVIPKNKNVCANDLTPITNNQIEHKKRKKDLKPVPSVSLQYDFDLLSSFNNAQIDNIDESNNKNINTTKSRTKSNTNPNANSNNYELITDIRSLNSLENDLISNY